MNNDQDNRNQNDKSGKDGRGPLRTGLPLLVIAIVVVLLFNFVYNSIASAQLKKKTYTEFLQMVDRGELAEVQFETDRVQFLTKEEAEKPGSEQTVFYTGLISNTDNTQLVSTLKNQNVSVSQ